MQTEKECHKNVLNIIDYVLEKLNKAIIINAEYFSAKQAAVNKNHRRLYIKCKDIASKYTISLIFHLLYQSIFDQIVFILFLNPQKKEEENPLFPLATSSLWQPVCNKLIFTCAIKEVNQFSMKKIYAIYI